MNTSIDYRSLNNLSEIWAIAAEKFGEIVALEDPHAQIKVKLTYTQLFEKLKQFAAGLQASGVIADTTISLFADNSARWFIADQGSMMAGAANVVRSSGADRDELLYILRDSDSTVLIVENLKTLEKLRPLLSELPIQLIVLLSDEPVNLDESIKILNFKQLLELGAKSSFNPVKKERHALASLMYTSGTTGQPKGVMLTHANLLHQVNTFEEAIAIREGDRVLSILPSWHAYERSCEYFLLSRGCTQIYTNIRSFKNDLKQFQPHVMVGVPRLWESLYETIQKQFREQSATKQKLVNFFLKASEDYIKSKRVAENLSLENLDASGKERLLASLKATSLAPLHALGDRLAYQKIRAATGGNLHTVVSGGGSLAKHLDDFYEIVGINLIVGYGLTETAPVTNVRTYKRNLRGSAGQPLPQTEIRIVDLDTKKTLAPRERGLVLIRGAQVMQGYYKKPEATAKAIDAEGWFDSGDLGWVTPEGDLVLTGRAKDTIVLNNGENIEPQPIEDACLRSPYIDQIMLVGQDEWAIGALIVPNLDALKARCLDGKASPAEIEASDLNSAAVRELFRQELDREVKNRPGYRADDQIRVFMLILEPFSIENGMMTQTLKIKRPVVTERYRDIIVGMYKK